MEEAEVEGESLRILKAAVEGLKGAFGSDPAVITISAADSELEFLARIDLAEHEKVRGMTGRAYPLRLAGMLPGKTNAWLSLRFNEQTKEVMLAALGPLASGLDQMGLDQLSGLGDSIEFIEQFAFLIDDELAIASTGTLSEEGVPNLLAMLAVTNRDPLANLPAIAPGPLVETYRNVDIKKVPVESPVPLYHAVARNTVLIATSVDELKGVVDRLLNRKRSDLFDSFSPAIDGDTRRYAALFLKPNQIATEAVEAILLDREGTPGEPKRRYLFDLPLKDTRFSVNLAGTWLEARFNLHFKKEHESSGP